MQTTPPGRRNAASLCASGGLIAVSLAGGANEAGAVTCWGIKAEPGITRRPALKCRRHGLPPDGSRPLCSLATTLSMLRTAEKTKKLSSFAHVTVTRQAGLAEEWDKRRHDQAACRGAQRRNEVQHRKRRAGRLEVRDMCI